MKRKHLTTDTLEAAKKLASAEELIVSTEKCLQRIEKMHDVADRV